MSSASSVVDLAGVRVAPVQVRKARVFDVEAMHRLINHYAGQQLMLPKTNLQLYENLRDYHVAVETADDNKVLGCGALHIYWTNLAEIRALAVFAGNRPTKAWGLFWWTG